MKNLYIILLISVLAYACTDLDEISYERIPIDVYPENETQLATVNIAAYSELSQLIDDAGWWFWAQEASSDELVFPTRDADWDDGGKWRVMHQHSWNNDVEGVNRMWDHFWQGITLSNKHLDFFRQLEFTENTDLKIKETEVLRCFYYYLLIDNYGDAPYLTTTIDVPEQPKKISRAAIFDSITTTIEKNYASLKAIDNKYLVTRYMAFSLLAKLYLNSEVYTGTPQWEKAGQYVDSVLAGPYTLDGTVTGPFLTENQNNSEIIFSIPFDEDNTKGFRIHMRTLHYQNNLTYDMAVGPWNGCAAVYDHFLTYEDNDLRKEAYFIYGPQYNSKGQQITESVTGAPLDIDPEIPAVRMDATYTPMEIRTTGARIGKYEIKKGAKENLSNDFPLFRLSDFYLMKAETEIRLGRNGDDWVNLIRDRAGVELWTNTTLDMLLAERGREMFVEGHRRQDLIRFGKFTNSWWGKGDSQGGISGDPEVLTFPIPQWAIDVNENLAN